MGNQVLHFIGSTLFFALLILAFILPNYWLIAGAIFIGYLLPGIGHRFSSTMIASVLPSLFFVCSALFVSILTHLLFVLIKN